MLTLYRASSGTGLREMAADIGVSAATLSRIERGYAMDATSLLVLWGWLLGDEGGPAADAAGPP
jgi:transcriptional regulator with XRE-family HTH domain